MKIMLKMLNLHFPQQNYFTAKG